MSCSSQDKRFMRMAAALGRRNLGRSSPNPSVGAVVVADGKVVGAGSHPGPGQAHAEVLALRQAGELARGATVYVTLEPCNHHGRTPPCTEALLAAGVKRVVYGVGDPNPNVAGGGGEYLASKGLEVVGGIERQLCWRLHRWFFTWVTTGRPHVILKMAATLDGRVATATGHSQWVSSEVSRRYVHRIRGWVDAVAVGVGTVLSDNPRLTCRVAGGRDPLRVVVDAHLRTPVSAKVLGAGCVVFCRKGAPAPRREGIEATGARVVEVEGGREGLDLGEVLDVLGREGVTSLMVEGGPILAWSLVRQGLVEEMLLFIAPKFVGGGRAITEGKALERMDEAIPAGRLRARPMGPDLLVCTTLKDLTPPEG